MRANKFLKTVVVFLGFSVGVIAQNEVVSKAQVDIIVVDMKNAEKP